MYPMTTEGGQIWLIWCRTDVVIECVWKQLIVYFRCAPDLIFNSFWKWDKQEPEEFERKFSFFWKCFCEMSPTVHKCVHGPSTTTAQRPRSMNRPWIKNDLASSLLKQFQICFQNWAHGSSPYAAKPINLESAVMSLLTLMSVLLQTSVTVINVI